MSATTKRILFLVSTAAFTISLNGTLAHAEVSSTAQDAIASQKVSVKSHYSTLKPELDATQTDVLAQGQPAAPAPSTSDDAAPTGVSPRPITTPDRDTNPDSLDSPSLDSPTNADPLDTPTSDDPQTGVDEFGDPVPGRVAPDTEADELGNPAPGTTSPDATGNEVDEFGTPVPDRTTPNDATDTEVDEFGNPVPDTTTPDGTLDTDDTDGTDDTVDFDVTPEADFSPGRATRSGPSYIGIGGNIGLGDGDTAVGEGAFAVISKIGLTNYLSFRPAVLFSDDPTFLIPLTFDFIPGITDVTEDLSGEVGLRISPFIGGGVALSTGDDSDASFLITGGADVPLSDRISAAASLNLTLGDETAIGLILGVGYNF